MLLVLWELFLLYLQSSFSLRIWIFKAGYLSESLEVLNLDLNFLLDDDTESNVTTFLSTTISSIEDTTQDDDEHDDDESIPDHEKRDEINDSKEIAKN